MAVIAPSTPVRQRRVLPLAALSDERLAELGGAGYADAFATLYERYRDALSRYCRSIVRDPEDAGDALQNTMLAVLRAVQVRGPSGPVRPWLYRIAHNESISILRRRHPHEELSAETPDRADTEGASFTRDRLDSLLVDLRGLPERQRGALVMRELGGLEYSEIGEALDMSPVSARKHVFEARVALHDIAAGRDADCGDIVRRISDGDGRVLRARSVRGHLRGCPACSAFERGLRTRRNRLALIPVLPVVSSGGLLAAALHGGGAGSTSGFTAGGSVAGGSVATGAVAAGSLLGGGSVAAVKGLVVAGAIAVAGAGVIVGTAINSHVRRPHRTAQLAHVRRVHRARIPVAATSTVVKPVRVASAWTHVVARPTAYRAAGLRAAPSTPHAQAVASQPATPRASLSEPDKQAPSTTGPAATTTPVTSAPPASPPPPGTTSTTATAPPAAGVTAPSTGTAVWINDVIQNALQTAGGNVAAAEAQAAQTLSLAGVAPTPATVQGIVSSILYGWHG